MGMREEQARFFGKLAALMEGGVPMLRAFEVAAERVEHEGLHAALDRVLKSAYSGRSIAEAVAKESPVFSPEVIVLLGRPGPSPTVFASGSSTPGRPRTPPTPDCSAI